MTRRVDFDAIHRARQETNNDRPVAIFGGIEYELPSSPPAAVLIAIGRVQAGNLAGVEDILVALFGVANLDAILAAGFELDDIGPIFSELYGIDPGESPASGGSSPTTSRPSKPTSSGTTGSTSPTPSPPKNSAVGASTR